ncbi:hypothetical protein AB0M35_14505 [Micromonospora sp. NPDC051196]|uniref:hypothetical protein n=1 Tax=Micromonospora sp. NPDC051196 TaxID=3155281 RepID=UPI0034130B45
MDVAGWAAEADRAEDRLVWLATLLLIGVSAGYGAIAVANPLLMAAAGRITDLRLIRLAGAPYRPGGHYATIPRGLPSASWGEPSHGDGRAV